MRELFINGRFLTSPITGVGRFAIELCKALKEQEVDFTLLVPKRYKATLNNPLSFKIKFIGFSDSHIWEQFSLWRFMSSQKQAILVSFSGLGPVLIKNKIVTIHDLSFFHEPKWFSNSYYLFYKIFTPLAIKRSLKILTVSEFSKSEILKYLKVESNKVIVIHNGNSMSDIQYDFQSSDRDYILGVSSLDPRKNHQFLINSFLKVSNQIDIDLILVGKAESHFNFKLDIPSHLMSKIKFTGYISDQDLARLYHKAKLFVYPSLYEGFGIPPLEAIFYRCPVLASNIPVFEEIFEDTIQYFNINSDEDLANKIIFCLSNRSDLILSEDRRKEILGKYSWENSALKIIKLINENPSNS